jgi:competence protein ComGF
VRKQVVDSGVREWHVKRALESMVALAEIAKELTLAEVMYCLALETKTRRRKSILNALIRHAARLNKRDYVRYLKGQYL